MVLVALLGALWAAVAALLALMCATDVRERRIPNRAVMAVCVLWVLMQVVSYLFAVFAGLPLAEAARAIGVTEPFLQLFALPSAPVGLLTAAISVVCFGGAGALYQRFFHKQAMGAGDVKLIGAFALFLGPVGTVVCVMLACALALVVALSARLRTFPFAPALAVAFACAIFIEL